MQNYRQAVSGPETLRKRRATANRILTALKAALNHAWKAGQITSDNAWRRVKPFKGSLDGARPLSLRNRMRTTGNACEPAFRNLVRGAVLTVAGTPSWQVCMLPILTPTRGSSRCEKARPGSRAT